MHYDFFSYAETSRRPWAAQVARGARCHSVELPPGLAPEAAIAAARKLGVPYGSSRSGAFEIQTDAGIWSRSDGRGHGRLTDAGSVFKSWDQLAAEEVAA